MPPEIERPLKLGTLKCPRCKNDLHFENFQGMRIVVNDLYSAFCPSDKVYFYVKTKRKKKIV